MGPVLNLFLTYHMQLKMTISNSFSSDTIGAHIKMHATNNYYIKYCHSCNRMEPIKQTHMHQVLHPSTITLVYFQSTQMYNI